MKNIIPASIQHIFLNDLLLNRKPTMTSIPIQSRGDKKKDKNDEAN
jgi:hypothetical protein